MSPTHGNREEAAIIMVVDQETAAASGGDVKAYEAILADDAVFMPPNGHSRSGTDLRVWLRQFLERFAVEWLSFEHGDVMVDGRHGYHCYEYIWRVTARDVGETTINKGKGLHVMRREAYGSWKILREIWNASPAGDI
jgi:ketosteroid isomerase-like protein